MSEYRILVVDDHEVIRRGVRALAEGHAGWSVCGEASTGREAVTEAQRLRPDLVILDISMPELNGLEAARQISRLVPQAKILILTVHDSEQVAREALEAGARGLMLKSDVGRDLLAAVSAIQAGRPHFTKNLTERMLSRYLGGDPAAPPPSAGILTPREREVLQLLAEGKTNRQVARTLRISLKTVLTHRANLQKKVGAHNLAGLVRYAIRNHLIEP